MRKHALTDAGTMKGPAKTARGEVIPSDDPIGQEEARLIAA
jgi:hypothetical protein